jgi:Na+/H+ antiporter NhaD/arsenite permease-like protein
MVLAVFLFVYAGMFLGELPRLQVDRSGIALLGAIALLVTEAVPLDRAVAHVHVPTLALLFGMMVLSAQLRMGGVYRALTVKVARWAAGPPVLLAAVVGLVGVLSAALTNDIVCLAVAPVVLRICEERRLDPVPFLLGVACAANVGSAATLVGNPQNILIGEALSLSFARYLALSVAPAALGLVAVWAIVAATYRARWEGSVREVVTHAPALPALDRWQAGKGLVLTIAAMAAFVWGAWPRDLVALAAAGIVLTGRRFHSRDMLGLVDWQLLVLFVGLFVVNGALADTGLVAQGLASLASRGVQVGHPAWLFGLGAGLSNVVSNVPAVMLLLPAAAGHREGAALALASTLAGNLLIVGSIANIIVIEQARGRGVGIDWRTHARVGIPVTLVTLALAAGALALAR